MANTRRFSRILALLLTACLLLGSVPVPAEGQAQAKGTAASHFRTQAAEDGLRIVKLLKKDKQVSVPAHINGLPVVAIGPSAFAARKQLRQIYLPATVRAVESRAFAGCTKLAAVFLTEGALTIGENAFANCKKLATLVVPASLTQIDPSAFSSGMAVGVYGPADCYAQRFVAQYQGPATLQYTVIDSRSARSLTIEGPNTLGAGETVSLTAVPIPGDAAGNPSVAWRSAKPEIARIDPATGALTGVKAGKTVITATLGELSATHEVQVLASGAFSAESVDQLFQAKAGKQPIGRLALLSMNMADCAYAPGKPTTELKKLGFTDIAAYNYPEPQMDHGVAFTLAKRALRADGQTYTLYAAIVRGTHGTGREWLSNAEMGTGENHLGFSTAGNEVYDKLVKFIGDADPKTTKIWITGHSRGAAVTNYVSKRLWDKGYNTGNLYGYAFACPTVTKKPDTSVTVFNFNVDGDLVPKVPLVKWGYGHNGTTLLLKDGTAMFNKMTENYKKLTKKKYEALTGAGSNIIAKFLYEHTATAEGFAGIIAYLRKNAPKETANVIESLWTGGRGALIKACLKLAWKLAVGIPESERYDAEGVDLVKWVKDFIELVKTVYKTGSNSMNAHEGEVYISWMMAQYGA